MKLGRFWFFHPWRTRWLLEGEISRVTRVAADIERKLQNRLKKHADRNRVYLSTLVKIRDNTSSRVIRDHARKAINLASSIK